MFQRKCFWGWLLASAIFVIGIWRVWGCFWQPASLVHWLEQAGPWQPVWFIAANFVANSIGVPGTLLVVAGGAVFGLAWGTLWSVVGATLGAIGAFGLSRYLLHDWFVARFGRHPQLLYFNQLMHQHGLRVVLAIRLAPISPFNLVNSLLGLSTVRFYPYAIGTCIGIIPGTFAYTWLGASGRDVLQGKGSVPLILSLSLLSLLTLLPIVITRWQRARSRPN
jgi:uncharacterized membrane protein YdjX (TVP38/TMEM64 family)